MAPGGIKNETLLGVHQYSALSNNCHKTTRITTARSEDPERRCSTNPPDYQQQSLGEMATDSGTPRYSAEDFETASIRSAAPSYVSEAPSYHSTATSQDVAPTYTATVPTANPAAETPSRRVESHMANTTPEPLGLPPIPALPRSNNSLLQNYRLPTWPTANAPAAMHYRKVAERRVVDGRYQNPTQTRRQSQGTHVRQPEVAGNGDLAMLRPLEDPYLVGEEAAAQARRERIGRETSSDVLQSEDRHWDWLIAQMRGWEEQERSWARLRRRSDAPQRRRLAGAVGSQLLSTQ